MAVLKHDLKLEQVVQKIDPRNRLLRSWPLKGGISAQMTALEIEDPSGHTCRMILRQPGQAALRQNQQAAEIEFQLLQTTRSLGLATPTAYELDLSGQIFSTPYLVIEYVEGQPEFTPAHPADFIHQMAEQLARIHGIDRAQVDFSFLPRPAQGFAGNYGERPARVDRSLDEGRIRDMLEAAWPFPRPNPPTLLHGDYWPGNILWRDEQLVAVIDWEDARLGDPLADLAISRLDLLWIFGIEAMNSFTRHYLSRISIDTGDLPYWDLCAALRLVRLAGLNLAGWVAFFIPYGRRDISEQTIREHYRWFINQAFVTHKAD